MHTPHHTNARRLLDEDRDHRGGDPARRTAEPRSWEGGDDTARAYEPGHGYGSGGSAPPGRYGYGRGASPRGWDDPVYGPRAGGRDLDWRDRNADYGGPAYRQPTGQGGMMNAGEPDPGSPLFYGQSGWRPGEPDLGQGYGRMADSQDDWATRTHAPGAQIWRGPESPGTGHHDFEPDYLHWREARMRDMDRDYLAWREERRQKFSQDFDDWRSRRDTARAGDDSPETENPNVGDVADGGTGGGDDESKKR